MENINTPDNEYCNFLRHIRESVNQKGCSLTKDEANQIKSDLLDFIHAITQGYWRKPEDIQALNPAIELVLTFFA